MDFIDCKYHMLIKDARLGVVLGLDEPGLLQVVYEDSVDELILRHCLNHQHPLLPQMCQHLQHQLCTQLYLT